LPAKSECGATLGFASVAAVGTGSATAMALTTCLESTGPASPRSLKQQVHIELTYLPLFSAVFNSFYGNDAPKDNLR
jgi:hypothetical protein